MSNGCRAQQQKSQTSQAAHHSKAAKVVMMQHSRSKNTRGVPHQPKGQRQDSPPADSSPGRLNLRPRTNQPPDARTMLRSMVRPECAPSHPSAGWPIAPDGGENPKNSHEPRTQARPTIARSPEIRRGCFCMGWLGFHEGVGLGTTVDTLNHRPLIFRRIQSIQNPAVPI